MAWNEPGGNKKDPWGNRGSNGNGPPDLDELFSKFQEKLGGLFGQGRDNKSGGGGNAGLSIGLVLMFLGLIYVFLGIYIVDEDERGVVLQFGKFVDITQPGIHWYPPVVQSVETVNVTGVRSVKSNAQVLTGDENIVQVSYTVQYNLKSPEDYLFNLTDPDQSLQEAGESAFREVIGKNTLDYIIQESREAVSGQVKELLQDNLDLYGSGIEVTTVNLEDAQPPQEVQGAFDDAIKAREDKDRFLKEAEAYRNEVIPSARGEARKQVEQAKAYKVSVTKAAEGEADRFLKLLAQYRKAPKVTRERLYIETIENVLSNSGKVLIDLKEGGNNLMYLPLDKLGASSSGQVYIEPSESEKRALRTDREGRIDRPSGNSRGGFRSRESR